MFILDILNVIIGLSFVFFLAGIFVSWAKEVFSSLTGKRNKNLESVLAEMIGPGNAKNPPDSQENETNKVNLLERLLEHPLIIELGDKGNKLINIPTRNFVLALMDILKQLGENPESPAGENSGFNLVQIKQGITKIKNQAVRKRLLTLVEAADAFHKDVDKKLAALEKNIQNWFDTMMKKATAIYQQYTKVILFVIGVLVAVGFNLDSITLTEKLWRDSALKTLVSNVAVSYIESADPDAKLNYNQIMDEFAKIKIPIGWTFSEGSLNIPKTIPGILLKILGLLISAFAISQGSPFWYDLLKRLIKGKNVLTQGENG